MSANQQKPITSLGVILAFGISCLLVGVMIGIFFHFTITDDPLRSKKATSVVDYPKASDDSTVSDARQSQKLANSTPHLFTPENFAVLSTGKKHREIEKLIPQLSPEQLRKLITALSGDERFDDVADLVSPASGRLMSENMQGYLDWVKGSFDERTASKLLLFSVENAKLSNASELWKAIQERWPGPDAERVIPSFMNRLADENPQKALALTQSLFPDHDQKFQALDTLFSEWGHTQPQEAMQALLVMPQGREKEPLFASAFYAWYRESPSDSETFLQSTALPPELRQKGVAILVEAKAAQNAETAAQWLSSQPSNAVSGEAIVNLSQHIALSDPQTALAWNNQISETPLREVNQYELIRKWAAVDLKGATEYFHSNPLTDPDLQNRLQQELGTVNNPATAQ